MWDCCLGVLARLGLYQSCLDNSDEFGGFKFGNNRNCFVRVTHFLTIDVDLDTMYEGFADYIILKSANTEVYQGLVSNYEARKP